MTAADYRWGTWPPSQVERDLRAQLTAATDALAAVVALVVNAEAKDGRVPACALRTALNLPPRWRTR